MILRFDGIHVRIGGKEIVKGADLCTEEGRDHRNYRTQRMRKVHPDKNSDGTDKASGG